MTSSITAVAHHFPKGLDSALNSILRLDTAATLSQQISVHTAFSSIGRIVSSDHLRLGLAAMRVGYASAAETTYLRMATRCE